MSSPQLVLFCTPDVTDMMTLPDIIAQTVKRRTPIQCGVAAFTALNLHFVIGGEDGIEARWAPGAAPTLAGSNPSGLNTAREPGQAGAT